MPRRNDDLALLARVVGRPTTSSLDGVDDARLGRLAQLAMEHRVVGSLVVAARAAGRELPDELARANDAVLVNHLRSLAALQRAGHALDEAGVGWAVVKGPALARYWARSSMARSYDDLDLLVDPRSLHVAVEALRDLGFDHRNRNWSGFRTLGVGEVPLDDGSVVIDLHWSLLGLAEQRRAFSLPTSELLERAVTVQLGPVEARTLDAADTFTHIGVHHALAGGRRLVQLMDVHLVSQDVEPVLARRRLREAGATRLVAAIVDRARRVFGDGPAVADELDGHRLWVLLNRAVDTAWRRTRRDAALPGAFVAAGRADARHTIRALATNLDVWIRTRSGRSTLTSDGGPLDWSHDGGDTTSYDQFLREVEIGRHGR